MKWMISIRYKAVFVFESGKRDYGEAGNAVFIIDVHPAVYLAEAKAQLVALDEMTDEQRAAAFKDTLCQRADDIEAVFWTMELAPGVLTPEQEGLFE